MEIPQRTPRQNRVNINRERGMLIPQNRNVTSTCSMFCMANRERINIESMMEMSFIFTQAPVAKGFFKNIDYNVMISSSSSIERR